MTPWTEMGFDEQINFWSGRLLVAIGAGKFRDEVCLMLGATVRAGADYEKEQQSERAKRKSK